MSRTSFCKKLDSYPEKQPIVSTKQPIEILQQGRIFMD